MFLQSHWGLMSRGPAVQGVNGNIIVRAPGFPSSSVFPYWGYDPVGSTLMLNLHWRAFFARGELGDFQWELWTLVSGS